MTRELALAPEGERRDRVRYRFPPLERRGVIAGWRGGQIAAVAGGLLIGVFAIRSRPSMGGVVLAVVGLAVGLGLAFWPINGRTGEQWLPLVARWLWSALVGGHLQLSSAPTGGRLALVDSIGTAGSRAIELQPMAPVARSNSRSMVLDGLTVAGTPFGSQTSAPELGMVIDARARTATAALVVSGHSFALLGSRDQDGQIAAWGRVLSSMAREGSDVHRVQWIESCLPDDGGAVRRHFADHAVLSTDSPAGHSYRTLVDEAAPVTRRHHVRIALSIRTGRSSLAARASGKDLTRIGRILSQEVSSLHRALEGADISVDGVLGPSALAREIEDASIALVDTWERDGRRDDRCADPGEDRADSPRWPWPMAVEPTWDAVRTDGTWHSTYWIAEWPRVDVTPDFLGPLLFSPLRRSISLVMEPMSPSRAARQVAQARTADVANTELRRRGGFLVTARQIKEKQSVEQRDADLADGHAQYRFSGYVTVTSDTREELEVARAAIEQAASQSGIELRLLYGAQDAAFTCSLPLGRGLT
jgi:hypothetical protein